MEPRNRRRTQLKRTSRLKTTPHAECEDRKKNYACARKKEGRGGSTTGGVGRGGRGDLKAMWPRTNHIAPGTLSASTSLTAVYFKKREAPMHQGQSLSRDHSWAGDGVTDAPKHQAVRQQWTHCRNHGPLSWESSTSGEWLSISSRSKKGRPDGYGDYVPSQGQGCRVSSISAVVSQTQYDSASAINCACAFLFLCGGWMFLARE